MGQVVQVAGCESCDLTPELVIELGSFDGPGAFGNPAHIVQRHNGQWALVDNQGRGDVLLFTPEGEFLRTVGRRGQGPGEYDLPLRLKVLPGDSLLVVDYFGLRLTFLDPSLNVARIRRLGPYGTSVALLPDGRHVVSGNVRSAEAIGLPHHLISQEGLIVRSYGADPPIEQIGNSNLMRRDLAEAGGGAVWSAPLLDYVIERWDTAGRNTLTLVRPESGVDFKDYYSVSHDPEQAPTPGLLWIHSDSLGRIWTATDVPDASWTTAFIDGRDGYGRRAKRIADLNKYFDTLIEVIDPGVGAVVGRVRLDERVNGFAGDGLVFTVAHRGAGYPVARVWRLQLPQPSP